ncbi:hypothetical protein JK178_07025 [Gluconobacter cerinus]|nr:hypothetical protein [Gluconobacter cerinus]
MIYSTYLGIKPGKMRLTPLDFGTLVPRNGFVHWIFTATAGPDQTTPFDACGVMIARDGTT